ncbi:MinD/ParA family ATP-binding protein [Arthrobacter pigmenti]
MTDTNIVTPLVMTAAAPALIADKSGTTVEAPTLEAVHQILQKSARLSGGTIPVQQEDPAGNRFFRFHSDAVIEEDDEPGSAEWTVTFLNWTASVDHDPSYKTTTLDTGQSAVHDEAQTLATRTGNPVHVKVLDLAPSDANPIRATYTPQQTPAATTDEPEPPTVYQPTRAAQPQQPPAAPTAETVPAASAPVEVPNQADPDRDTYTLLGHRLDLDGLLDTSPARQGFSGFMNTMGFKIQPQSAETVARREEAELLRCEQVIRQATWERGSVAFTIANKKGNAGKTPLSVCIGGMISSIRGGSLAMMEVSDDPGQLAGRSEGDPRRGIGELVVNAEKVHSKAQLEGYAVPQTSFAHSFGSSPHRRDPLTFEAIQAAAALIDRFYTIRAMDSGNVYTSSAFTGALATSDALLIPTMNATDSMAEAVELFKYLESHHDPHFRELANRAIIVRISDGRPEYKIERMVNDLINQTGISPDRMFTIPYDAHIAERGPITLARLAPTTRSALTRIGAALITQLQDAAHDDHPGQT